MLFAIYHQVGASDLEEQQEDGEEGFLQSEQILSYVYDDGQVDEDTESPIKLEVEQEHNGLLKQSLPDDNEQVDVVSPSLNLKEKEEKEKEKEVVLTSLEEEEGRESILEQSPRNDKHAKAKHSSPHDGKLVDASSLLLKLELKKEEEEGREQFMKDSGELNFEPLDSMPDDVAYYDGPVQKITYYQSLRARRHKQRINMRDQRFRMERIVARWKKWFEDDEECKCVILHSKSGRIWLAKHCCAS